MSWTDERVTLLKRLWCEGRTAAEIAKELGGVTRNAVIGKAHRLKLSNRVSPIQQNTKKPAAKAAPEEKPAPRAKSPAIAEKFIKVKGVKLAELKEKMCRWPIGDPRDTNFMFCGCNSVAGLVYCADHARIAYQVAKSNRLMRPDDVDNGAGGFDEAEESKEAVRA